MIVRMTIKPASVKPRSDSVEDRRPRLSGQAWRLFSTGRLQIPIIHMVQRLPDRFALYVEDAWSLIGVVGIRVGGFIGVLRVVLDLLPIGLLRDRIGRDLAQVIGNELVEIVWIALLVGVEVVDRFAHLREVVA